MENGYDKTIKANLAQKRRERNLTQASLAEMLKIDRNTYRNIEAGATMMINPHLPGICGILGCSVEELLLGYDPEDTSRLEASGKAYGSGLERALEEERSRGESLRAEVSVLGERIKVLEDIIQDKTDLIRFLKEQNRALQGES